MYDQKNICRIREHRQYKTRWRSRRESNLRYAFRKFAFEISAEFALTSGSKREQRMSQLRAAENGQDTRLRRSRGSLSVASNRRRSKRSFGFDVVRRRLPANRARPVARPSCASSTALVGEGRSSELEPLVTTFHGAEGPIGVIPPSSPYSAGRHKHATRCRQ
jgi:hypothetical protein